MDPLLSYGRCLGVGGFPVDVEPIPAEARSSGLAAFDNRVYTYNAGILGNVTIGFNGYTSMAFDGPNVTLEYRSLMPGKEAGTVRTDASTLLVRERFTVDRAGSVDMAEFNIVDPGVTKIVHEQKTKGDVNDGVSHLTRQAQADSKASRAAAADMRRDADARAAAEHGNPCEHEAAEVTAARAATAEAAFKELAAEYVRTHAKLGKV